MEIIAWFILISFYLVIITALTAPTGESFWRIFGGVCVFHIALCGVIALGVVLMWALGVVLGA